MKFIAFIAGLLWLSGAHAQVTVEAGTGFSQTKGTHLVLLGFSVPAAGLLNFDSYYQFNAGGWGGGSRSAYLIGAARGLRWDVGQTTMGASIGASLISETNDLISTPFEFYGQIFIKRRIGGLDLGVSYRHWSNAGIKFPNIGMNFLGVQLEHSW